jgi:hypothetical protein
MPSPIFIVGANRSGTTLLRLILNAHSRIAIPEELIYFDSFLEGVPIEQWESPGLSVRKFQNFVEKFLTENCRFLNELEKHQLKRDILEGPHDLRHPYKKTLESWARHWNKPRWGEKTPGNLFYADVIVEMFPSARFIHMVRDPRAVVASMQGASFFPNDIVFNALSWRKHVREGLSTLTENVSADQRTTIRYEDLVSEPEETVQKLCTFLDEPYEPQVLQFHENAERYMKEEATSSFNTRATRPITASRTDAWKHQFTDEEVATIECLCPTEMEAFGYPYEGDRASLETRLEIQIKRAYWALQNWRHHDNRHYTVKHRMFARSRSILSSFWNTTRA